MTQAPHGRAHPRICGSSDGIGCARHRHRHRRRCDRRAIAIFAICRLIRDVTTRDFVIIVVVVIVVVDVDAVAMSIASVTVRAMLINAGVDAVVPAIKDPTTSGWPRRAGKS